MAKTQSWNVADDAEVAAAWAKENEIQELHRQANEDASAFGDGDAPSKAEADANSEFGFAPATKAKPKMTQAEALHRVRVTATALEKQRKIRQEAEHRASLRIATAAKAEHVALLKRIKEQVVPLKPALAAELEFRRKLTDGGVSLVALNPCPFRSVTPAAIDAWLAELSAKHGI